MPSLYCYNLCVFSFFISYIELNSFRTVKIAALVLQLPVDVIVFTWIVCLLFCLEKVVTLQCW